MAAPKNKSLEFRMAKKVAELTQVVHMLFTRNHEKEVGHNQIIPKIINPTHPHPRYHMSNYYIVPIHNIYI